MYSGYNDVTLLYIEYRRIFLQHENYAIHSPHRTGIGSIASAQCHLVVLDLVASTDTLKVLALASVM